MNERITSFVGLDMHIDSIAVGVAPIGREQPHFIGTVAPQWGSLHRALNRLGKPQALQIVYEAGPCGYTLARQLRAHGYACEVIAPAKIAHRPGDRIKTDRRDALLLARAARAGELVSVTIPDERDEAIRDLTRAREDAVRARLKARQQLKALLLRHGHRYSGCSSWTAAHERYLAGISFQHPAQDIAYAEYRSAVREANERVENLTQAMSEQLKHWRMRPLVEALMTLRGIELVAAMTLVAEIGDFTRFARPSELMGFLGLVPSEYSSGSKRAQGEITKTGNSHARRVLVEAAWNYRFPARMSRVLQQRQEGQSQAGAPDRLAGAAAPGKTLSAPLLAQAAAEQDLRSHRTRAVGLCVGHRSSGQAAGPLKALYCATAFSEVYRPSYSLSQLKRQRTGHAMHEHR